MTTLARTIFAHRALIGALALRTLRTRYAGTVAGAAWSVLTPAATVAVFWLVFSVGLRVRPASGVPFIAVFLCGFLPWSLFAESLTANASSITANAQLLKRTVFPAEVLAVANIAASLIVHAALLGILLVVLAASGVSVTLGALKFVYYLAGLVLFGLGLGWILSAVNAFFRDAATMLGVVLNVWFWLTPISWGLDIMPAEWRPWLLLNPMVYVVQGYQHAFTGAPAAAGGASAVVFWAACFGALAAGGFVFGRLKREFGEVL